MELRNLRASRFTVFGDKKDWMDFLARLKSLCDSKAKHF